MAQVRARKWLKGRWVPLAGLIAAVVVALIVGVFARGRGGVFIERGASAASATSQAAVSGAASQRADETPGTPETDEAVPILVHVDGAVMAPGVYALAPGSARANDAVSAAGGLAPDADTSSLNLAAQLADGDKLRVPRQGEAAAPSEGDSATAVSGSSSSGEAGSRPQGAGLVNINTATAEELDALPGVGASTAAAIVEDRANNGPFASVEDLMRVSGIGEKKFAKLKAGICV